MEDTTRGTSLGGMRKFLSPNGAGSGEEADMREMALIGICRRQFVFFGYSTPAKYICLHSIYLPTAAPSDREVVPKDGHTGIRADGAEKKLGL